MRLESPSAAPEIEKLILQIFVKNFPVLEQESDISQFIRLTPLVDAHFSTVGNKSASSRTTLYLLICVSFLIVIIATITFMNFSLAETPMRIKSINTGSNHTFSPPHPDNRSYAYQLYSFYSRAYMGCDT